MAGGDIPAGIALLHESVELAFAIGDRVGASTALHGIAQLWGWGSLQLATGADRFDALLQATLDAHLGPENAPPN